MIDINVNWSLSKSNIYRKKKEGRNKKSKWELRRIIKVVGLY